MGIWPIIVVVVVVVVVVLLLLLLYCFYIALFSALEKTHFAHVSCDFEWLNVALRPQKPMRLLRTGTHTATSTFTHSS